jgi:hypothetical protein
VVVIAGIPEVRRSGANNYGWLPIGVEALLVVNGARVIGHLTNRAQVVFAVEIIASANRFSATEELPGYRTTGIPLLANIVPAPNEIPGTRDTAAGSLDNLDPSPQSIVGNRREISSSGISDLYSEPSMRFLSTCGMPDAVWLSEDTFATGNRAPFSCMPVVGSRTSYLL